MKKEMKDNIVFVGSTMLTVGTSCMLGWMAGWGTTALANHVFSDGLTRGQLKVFSAVTFLGSVGVALATADTLYPKFTGYLQDVMDVFPTGPKEVKNVE